MKTKGLNIFPNEKDELYTLITGASAGIGKAMAKECAERKMNLVLVALPGPELAEYAAHLELTYNIKVFYFLIDLSHKNAAKQLFEWCVSKRLSVNVLINNAGVGHVGSFEESTVDFYQNMMQLNMQTLVTLTQLFIPELKRHSTSYILNVGSASALYPVPYKCVYSATKSFVLYFSKALRAELKNTQVIVSCVCPGVVMTNKEVRETINSAGRLGRLTSMSAEEVAHIAIKGLLKKKAIIIPGKFNKMLLFTAKFIPDAFIAALFGSFFRNLLKQDKATTSPASLAARQQPVTALGA